MKILFITEKFPYPLDSGGRIRTYHILKGLSREHEITLLTTIEREEQRIYIPNLEEVCRNVRIVKAPHETTLQLGFKVLKNTLSSVPIVVERHYLPEFAAEVNHLLHDPQRHYDVVHFDHLDASLYRRYVPETIITVIDEHNIVSNQIQTSAAAENNLAKRLYMKSQLEKTRRYEGSVCQAMTQCLVCSDADKASLLALTQNADVATIPNGVDVDFFHVTGENKWEKPSQETYSMIFVGTLDYGPGATAVRYFCQDIFPRIQEKIPGATFYAVGQSPPQYLRELAKQNSHIVVTGRVHDIRPYVARANVFVVPLKSGSGTRLKILDAMAMGIPVVSTSIGAEGIAVRSGDHILLADTPEAFSAAVLKLLQNETLAQSLRANALELVRKQYDWQHVWTDLLAVYKTLEQKL